MRVIMQNTSLVFKTVSVNEYIYTTVVKQGSAVNISMPDLSTQMGTRFKILVNDPDSCISGTGSLAAGSNFKAAVTPGTEFEYTVDDARFVSDHWTLYYGEEKTVGSGTLNIKVTVYG